MTRPDPAPISSGLADEALTALEAVCRRHGISALDDFLASCRAFAREETLNVAVLGRFKAGKSSFLNHLLGRALLPVGAIPVTSVVTEIEWGPREQARIRYADGREDLVGAEQIGDFISEGRNPENRKQVARVLVELPAMARYRGIRFVDTPGLESVLTHNSDTALEWLPNVGLALVAVGVDPPLSQHDIELIRKLSRYTPHISLLLTKVDVLDAAERVQVRGFVRQQLARYWDGAVPVFPYSVRPGFESLRTELEAGLFARVHAQAGEERAAILAHKLDSLLGQCADYLHVARKAAEAADSERDELRRKILGEKEGLDDTRLAPRLMVQHAAGGVRSAFETLLHDDEQRLREKLQAGLGRESSSWSGGLGGVMERFEDWMQGALAGEMAELSHHHRAAFIEPVRRVSRQLSQALQDFRNRLSERLLKTLGVPLRTTEMELDVEDPKSPDVRVGKVFDRNWELLSWLIPMPIVRGVVLRHFRRKVADLVFTNLSRLAAQWEALVSASLQALGKESARRLDSLIGTIEKLIAASAPEAPRIQADIERLEALRDRLSASSSTPRS